MKCRDALEKIQELLDKDKIKYKVLAANVMTVNHSSSSIELQKKEIKTGKMEILRIQVDAMEVPPALVEGVKKECHVPLP